MLSAFTIVPASNTPQVPWSDFAWLIFNQSFILYLVFVLNFSQIQGQTCALFFKNFQGLCIVQSLIFKVHFGIFMKIFNEDTERRRRDLNPRAAINDLLPFQGSPFNHLGTSAWLTSLAIILFLCPKRREWDSNPRALMDKRFSRPPRYDHFDISPNVLCYFIRYARACQGLFCLFLFFFIWLSLACLLPWPSLARLD